MSSQSASSSVVTGVPLYTVANSNQYRLSCHQTDSSSSCSPVMFMMNNSSSYVYVISGVRCSLQHKDQPVPKLVFSSESESESIGSEESVLSSGISIFSCCKAQRDRGHPDCGL